jgi:hypothetical protein
MIGLSNLTNEGGEHPRMVEELMNELSDLVNEDA